MDLSSLSTSTAPFVDKALDIVVMILGALLLWFVGRFLIGLVKTALHKAMTGKHVDETLIRYAVSAVSVLLNVVLLIAILSVFGVETTTFAGLIAAAGVAIGMAWSGLLANFAAGAFLMVLRPFKVKDFVEAAGMTGTVTEIGLFVTAIDTPDNVRVFVGNNAVLGGTIKNYSTNPFRRVDLTAQLAGDTDPLAAIEALRARLVAIPNVSTTPAPDLEILEYNLVGPVLAVRPYCHTDHYWQVYFDTNKAIREAFGQAGFNAPRQRMVVQQEPV